MFFFLSGRARYFFLAGAFLLCFVVFFLSRSSDPRPVIVKVKILPVETSRRNIDIPVIAFDSVAYYRPIIKNNLFRPLGWTPPVPREPYRLIGTILPRSRNTSATAVLETTDGNVRYIVSVGDKIEVSTEVI